MGFRLERLDSYYSASFVPPLLALVNTVPDAVKHLYRTFVARYPWIPLSAFRALPTTNLAEVGVSVHLLEERLILEMRVDQIAFRATNLRSDTEGLFLRDCVLLLHSAVQTFASEPIVGPTSFRAHTWLAVDGGEQFVDRVLHRTAWPQHTFPQDRIGAKGMLYTPRVELFSEDEGWRLIVTAEKSVLPSAQLFVIRDYAFAQGTKHATVEQKIAFVETSTNAIMEWFGIGPAQ